MSFSIVAIHFTLTKFQTATIFRNQFLFQIKVKPKSQAFMITISKPLKMPTLFDAANIILRKKEGSIFFPSFAFSDLLRSQIEAYSFGSSSTS